MTTLVNELSIPNLDAATNDPDERWCILPPLFLSSPPTQTARRLPCAVALPVESKWHSGTNAAVNNSTKYCRHPGGGEP